MQNINDWMIIDDNKNIVENSGEQIMVDANKVKAKFVNNEKMDNVKIKIIDSSTQKDW